MKKGDLTYPQRLENKLTFIGDYKNPIAWGSYKELYANLDNEFYNILSMFSWHKSGLVDIDINSLNFGWVLGLKYLIDIKEVEEKQRVLF